MRIFRKECKKILDVRILLILTVFTIFYYQLFMQITEYPCGGQCTDSPYDIPFCAELIEELGPTLEVSDLAKIDRKQKELEEAYTKLIAEDKILTEAGINDYAAFKQKQEEFFDKDELTEDEKKISKELDRLIFTDEAGTKLYFEIQEINRIKDGKGISYGVSESEVQNYESADMTEIVKKTRKNIITRDYISLMPEGVFFILQRDMTAMAMLLLICFAVLLIPYQVRERLRFVQPLYASTAVGRKIFSKQFWSAVGACVLVGLVQFGVYLFIFIEKGLAVFWKCPCWDSVVNLLWCDGISFGTYMFLYMVLIFIYTLAAVAVFYPAARVATNYISGIAIAIPLCGGSCILSYLLFRGLFLIRNTDGMPFTEIPWIGGWLIVAGVILWWRFRRDRRRDL
ncbi:MAG: hypothetical protein ACI4FX_00630 [Agathobacter sp.]